MKKAIYPGSFDPVTLGHIDIIKRACKLVDELVVGVLINKDKTPLFSDDERVNMLIEATLDIPNVKIRTFKGLTADFAKEEKAGFIVRGLRAISDFDKEMQMAEANSKIMEGLDTIFLPTSLEYAFLSSSTVKEVASFGGNVDQFVPLCVKIKLQEKFNS